MTHEEETAVVVKLADAIQATLSVDKNPAITMAALELVITREMLRVAGEDETEADNIRAAAADLFDAAAAAELEALAAKDLGPWADSAWDDIPIPYLPTDENRHD